MAHTATDCYCRVCQPDLYPNATKNPRNASHVAPRFSTDTNRLDQTTRDVRLENALVEGWNEAQAGGPNDGYVVLHPRLNGARHLCQATSHRTSEQAARREAGACEVVLRGRVQIVGRGVPG